MQSLGEVRQAQEKLAPTSRLYSVAMRLDEYPSYYGCAARDALFQVFNVAEGDRRLLKVLFFNADGMLREDAVGQALRNSIASLGEDKKCADKFEGMTTNQRATLILNELERKGYLHTTDSDRLRRDLESRRPELQDDLAAPKSREEQIHETLRLASALDLFEAFAAIGKGNRQSPLVARVTQSYADFKARFILCDEDMTKMYQHVVTAEIALESD